MMVRATKTGLITKKGTPEFHYTLWRGDTYCGGVFATAAQQLNDDVWIYTDGDLTAIIDDSTLE